MKTRSGLCYSEIKRRKRCKISNPEEIISGKSRKFFPDVAEESKFHYNLFDNLPDDIVLCILSRLSSSSNCSSDFISVLLTCKRLNVLGFNSVVLSKASLKILDVKSKNWSDSSHNFLKLCAEAGNIEACYILGMIRFYCLGNRGSGASLMAKAAMASHARSLYSLAVIQFNGSGGSKNDKNLRAGVELCARAAFLGHVDARRELGHCLQDGYGVNQNIAEGRRFLIQANALELASVFSTTINSRVQKRNSRPSWNPFLHHHRLNCTVCLLSDFGCNIPDLEVHPANRFLIDWFASRNQIPAPGLRICSYSGCGRPETRRHEFRRCSVCGTVNYCSRACQAMDWKKCHKADCTAPVVWHDNGDDDDMIVGIENLNGIGEEHDNPSINH